MRKNLIKKAMVRMFAILSMVTMAATVFFACFGALTDAEESIGCIISLVLFPCALAWERTELVTAPLELFLDILGMLLSFPIVLLWRGLPESIRFLKVHTKGAVNRMLHRLGKRRRRKDTK